MYIMDDFSALLRDCSHVRLGLRIISHTLMAYQVAVENLLFLKVHENRMNLEP